VSRGVATCLYLSKTGGAWHAGTLALRSPSAAFYRAFQQWCVRPRPFVDSARARPSRAELLAELGL
jgi:hypothetical protein